MIPEYLNDTWALRTKAFLLPPCISFKLILDTVMFFLVFASCCFASSRVIIEPQNNFIKSQNKWTEPKFPNIFLNTILSHSVDDVKIFSPKRTVNNGIYGLIYWNKLKREKFYIFLCERISGNPKDSFFYLKYVSFIYQLSTEPKMYCIFLTTLMSKKNFKFLFLEFLPHDTFANYLMHYTVDYFFQKNCLFYHKYYFSKMLLFYFVGRTL